mmetsp:Transcript_13002/g.33879  ORF Transcript_13002/g.33879 Transcript_13002/m.33879 type:complete len:109 (-) Transcript_13002:68-394(-)
MHVATIIAARRMAMQCTRQPGARGFASGGVPPDHYDLRAVGAETPEPFEVNGEPTDITKMLANGQKQVGYSTRYAENWSRIFGVSSQASASTEVPADNECAVPEVTSR